MSLAGLAEPFLSMLASVPLRSGEPVLTVRIEGPDGAERSPGGVGRALVAGGLTFTGAAPALPR
ncbi:hypothetical protein ACQEVF_44310 [Nonomuraea polychroma]|uniref:hypothetical protein n=1 Tax=Nonomuraea polychroma TaxID=46176 RepID=UPI003D8DFB91